MNQKAGIMPVILCGGSGTRLWPMSRENYPKQFVDLGDGHTLFRDTLMRVKALEGADEPLIICNEKYRFYVTNELRGHQIGGDVILEPAPRNTAPAIALAAFSLLAKDCDLPMLVLPSDHHIGDVPAFCRSAQLALPLAEAGQIVAFGIQPTGPATGYGYIRVGQSNGHGFKVKKFIEKPDREKALKLLEDGDCCWNAGIFLLKPSVYLAELEKYSPPIYHGCQSAWTKHGWDGKFLRPDMDEFLSIPEDSIDYAVMEHTDRASVVPLAIDWDDLGSWESFFRYAPKDEANNAVSGEVILDNVADSYVRSSDRLVAAIGLSNVAIIETSDAVLVAKREDSEKVKNVVKELKKRGSYKYQHHPLVYRPWGSYETLARGDRFQVKRIVVEPGETLSLQKHHHRAEHWIVVSGTAEVTNDGKTTLFTENQSTYIPIGAEHRLRNPGIIPLVLIEIQSGSYLGENDIVRLEDIYGR